jgi:hypothetical protein
MTPREFYALQYSELILILDGYRERRKREMRERREESAWVVSWLLLPHKGKDAEPITPDQLMGRKPRHKRPQFADHRQAAIACFAALKAKSKQGEATNA